MSVSRLNMDTRALPGVFLPMITAFTKTLAVLGSTLWFNRRVTNFTASRHQDTYGLICALTPMLVVHPQIFQNFQCREGLSHQSASCICQQKIEYPVLQLGLCFCFPSLNNGWEGSRKHNTTFILWINEPDKARATIIYWGVIFCQVHKRIFGWPGKVLAQDQ